MARDLALGLGTRGHVIKLHRAAVGPFTDAHPGLGGVCTFVGEVRGDDGVEALELSHYEPLTLAGMEALADTVLARFDRALNAYVEAGELRKLGRRLNVAVS